ncbi:MAG: hypothetical protein ABSH04_06840 [Acidimicrobiales bacterium]
MAYSTWMASFTETVEARNPALTATGLAIWGSMARFVAMLGFIAIPFVITSAGTASNNSYVAMSPATANAVQAFVAGKTPTNWNPNATGNLTEIVNISPPAGTINQQYTHLVYIAAIAHRADFVEASKYTTVELETQHPALLARLLKDVNGNTSTLLAIDAIKPQLEFLAKYQNHILQLQAATAPTAAPRQWQHWLWVCFGCTAFFIPWVFVMRGRWSPRRAREDEREHRRFVESELARMREAQGIDATS